MAWLAVDKDGEESIFDGEPKRHEKYGVWEYYESYESEYINFLIELPKGTIQKMIGRELTWSDNPVELK